MFGYIVPDKGEMKIKEYELFRAYYCGVCKSMGKSLGPLCRFGLNYDSVFLGLFLSSLNNETVDLKKENCIANPFKKKWVVKNSKSLDFSADINILLTYYKLLDDWKDDRSFLARFAQIIISPGFKKALMRNKEAQQHIKISLEQLQIIEERKCESMDEAADPFGQMIKVILRIGCQEENYKKNKAIEWLGYNIGKWIYIIDAFDDIEKDIKKKNYNPLLFQFKYNNEEVEEFKDRIKEEIKFNLIHTLAQAASAFELLDLKNKNIIENILYLGMEKKTKTVLEGRSCNKDEKPL
ncbi:MAG: hypothetical protein GX201_13875 [Clostridiales bacterium]|nr:hypothetical protein [Clostridiales bacterium]